MKKNTIFLLLLIAISVGLSAQNRGVSFLKSAALPGLAQVSDGKSYGYAMMASEVAIIGSLLYFRNEEKLKNQEAYEYALKYAHISPGKHPQSYYLHLSRFNNGGFEADGYNTKIRKDAMSLYPHDPQMQQQYIDANAYPEDMYWSWESSSHRQSYSKIRASRRRMQDFGQIAVGTLLLNHLISSIDVLRYTSEGRRAQVSMKMKGNTPLINLGVKF